MLFRAAAFAVAGVMAAAVLGACSAANDGDCTGRIRYEDVLYRSHNALNQHAPAGERLGEAEVVGCGDVDSASAVDEVIVFSVKGDTANVAVIVEQGPWHGVYVSEDVPRSAWPRVLSRHENQRGS
ncbi:MAG: DUF6281 family protein [Propionicimonas sp.]